MIVKLRRWVTPFFTRLNNLFVNHWKNHGYTMLPDHPYYFGEFFKYPDGPRSKRFETNWERLL